MISHDLRNQRFRISVSYTTGAGKKCRLWRSAKTYKEAKRIEAQLILKVKGLKEDSKATIDDLFKNYIDHITTKRRKTTVEFYQRFYNNHIKDVLGDCSITEIDTKSLESWKASVDPDLSMTSKDHIYVTLHALFSYSDKVNGTMLKPILDKVGPFTEDPNKVSEQEEELHYWSTYQFEQFSKELKRKCLQFKKTSKFYLRHWSTYVLMNILFSCGLRKGEANALKISDFHDGVNPYLDITKSATCKVKGSGWIITNPKNKMSVRRVPVPQATAEIIREHIDQRLAHLPVPFTPDLFLVGGIEPLSDSTYDSIKRKIEEDIHLPHISIHDLRHSYVSVLVNNGIDLRTISALCGHSSTNMTWKIYSHLYPETLTEAASVFDRIMPPSPKELDLSKGNSK